MLCYCWCSIWLKSDVVYISYKNVYAGVLFPGCTVQPICSINCHLHPKFTYISSLVNNYNQYMMCAMQALLL